MNHLVLQLEILWPALLAGLLVLSTHVPLGQEVLRRGIIFLDLAIAQIAAFGVIIADAVLLHDYAHHSHLEQTLIAIVVAVIGSLLLYRIRRVEIRVQEAMIGILYVLSATGCILLLTKNPHAGERIKEILVGQILWIQLHELVVIAFIYAAVLAIWFRLKNRLGACIFYPLFALTVTLSTQIVGVFLVFSSLIIPNLATLNREKPGTHAFMIGSIGYIVGLVISALFDLPSGATIVWSLALIGLMYFLIFGKLKPSSESHK